MGITGFGVFRGGYNAIHYMLRFSSEATAPEKNNGHTYESDACDSHFGVEETFLKDDHEIMDKKPRIRIEYCSQCRFILRASWIVQELLFTFADDLEEVALAPGTGGVFIVSLDNEVIFDRRIAGRFPESKELKQLVRDRIDPGRSLGHSDRKSEADGESEV